jgi:hypothetical protein
MESLFSFVLPERAGSIRSITAVRDGWVIVAEWSVFQARRERDGMISLVLMHEIAGI